MLRASLWREEERKRRKREGRGRGFDLRSLMRRNTKGREREPWEVRWTSDVKRG